MKNEDKIIIELCNFYAPDVNFLQTALSQDIDLTYILGTLLMNRVGGVAYYTLSSNDLFGCLNREFVNSLKSVYESNIQKTLEFREILEEVSEYLSGRRFKYALLKGSYLQQLYPIGTRTSNDIDILISNDGLDILSKELIDNAFIQGFAKNGKIRVASRTEIVSSRINRGETVPFLKQSDRTYLPITEIDINTSLDHKATGHVERINAMLDNCVPNITTSHGMLYTLDECDLIIHLCCHLYKEATTFDWVCWGRDQGLYKYIDIYALMYGKDKSFVNDMVNRIHTYSLERECKYVFEALSLLYGKIFVKVFELLNEDKNNEKFIFDYKNKKTYTYNMSIVDWIFCKEKRAHLYETRVDKQ